MLIDHKGLDPELVWDTVEREQVAHDHHRRRRVRAPAARRLRARTPAAGTSSCLRAITSSGVLFSPDVKRGLLDELPGATIVDTLGASEGLGPSNASTVRRRTPSHRRGSR